MAVSTAKMANGSHRNIGGCVAEGTVVIAFVVSGKYTTAQAPNDH